MASASSDLTTLDLMEALTKDPVKRALILQLICKEKHNLNNYKCELLKTKATPQKRVNKGIHCESPTALHRRRALLEMQNQDTSESSSSDVSEVPSHEKGPELPFEELLKGVRAYIDVKRNDVDKSEGIKAIMKLMGATVRDTFTNDVTHVIFKDGSFTTYEKARLMKVHLVSILWLDAVRRNNARVPEKNYPAFGRKVSEENVSILCSQLQKDYETLVKDERRRRHTLMTPKTSISSYATAANVPLTDDENFESREKSPELTSDDSDCCMIDGHITKRSNHNNLLQDDKKAAASKKSSQNLQSSDSTSLLSCIKSNRRKTINTVTNMELTPIKKTVQKKSSQEIVDATPTKKKKDLESTSRSSLKSIESDKTISDLGNFSRNRSSSRSTKNDSKQTEENTKEVGLGTSSMSSLRMSDTDKTKSDLVNSNDSKRSKSRTRNSKESSSLVGNKENCSLATISTTMSSLRVSDTSEAKLDESKSSSGNLVSSLNKENKVVSECSSTSTVDEPKRRSRRRTMGPSKSKEPVPPAEPQNEKNKVSGTPKKSVRKSLIDSSDSECENNSKENSAKRNRTTPPTFEETETLVSKKTPVVILSKTSVNENTPRRSRRSSAFKSYLNVESKKTPGKRNNESTATSTTKSKAQKVQQSSTKKTRKLYNPSDFHALEPLDDTKEREEYSNQKSQKSQSEVFLNPNNIGITCRKKQKNAVEAITDEDVTKKLDKDASSNLDSMSSEDESPKQKLKNKKQKKIPPNGEADEQRDLLNLLNESRNTSRRSERLHLSQTKPKCTFSSSVSSVASTNLPITPIKRRSTLDFVPISSSQRKRKLKLDPKRATSIVCTKLHRHEVLEFEATVADLGSFFVEDKVTRNTSHLVAGESKRTINMLRAIARGCWIVRHDWLKKSKEAGKWLNEEDFELTEFSPAVQQCRMQREAFGPLYSMDIFKDCGYIYVARETTPKSIDLKGLILICKGHLTTIIENAKIVVGEFIDREEMTCVTEMWILDSIKFNKLQSFKKYAVKNDRLNYSSNSPVF